METGKTGTIFNIQKFSVHDGPGIRTTVFVKGCPLSCMWCSNAESMNPEPEIGFIRERCDLCGKCVEICPENAVAQNDKEIVFNRTGCNTCGKCDDVCPNDAITVYGREITVQDVMKEVIKDKSFYSGSEGGVTVSGGEPLRQAEFVAEIFRKCHEEGIHTCLDTSGYSSEENLKKVLEHADFVLYDLKVMNGEKHRQYTGVDNKIILDNAIKVAESNTPVLFRIPFISGVNNDTANIEETAAFLDSTGRKTSVEFLPYHRLGIGKYRTLDEDYRGKDLSTPAPEEAEKAKNIFEKHGIMCIMGG